MIYSFIYSRDYLIHVKSAVALHIKVSEADRNDMIKFSHDLREANLFLTSSLPIQYATLLIRLTVFPLPYHILPVRNNA